MVHADGHRNDPLTGKRGNTRGDLLAKDYYDITKKLQGYDWQTAIAW